MAKTPSKSTTKETRKAPVKTTKPKVSSSSLEKVSEDVLEKLRALHIEQELQNDIEWCLGSYRADSNPVGLYGTLDRALTVLRTEKDKKSKGVTAKFITDLEKAIEPR